MLPDAIPTALVLPVITALLAVIGYLNQRLNHMTDATIARLERAAERGAP